MSRPNLLKTDQHPYHVTSRCLEKKFFPLPMNQVWQIMLEQLYISHQRHHLKIHAFVLMGNHFHLLCQTPGQNLDEVMQSLLRSTSLSISRAAGLQGPIWSRYKWSLINAPSHYYQVYRYVLQNPLRAQLTEQVESYPYSSLHQVPFPLCTHVPMTFGGQKGENLWLNDRYSADDQKLIRLGLRKFQFDVNQRLIRAFQRLSLPAEEQKKAPLAEGPSD